MRFFILVGILLFSIVHSAFAYQTGGSIALPIITKDPPGLHGYRAEFWVQPQALLYSRFQVYFDAVFAHWAVSGNQPYRSLNAYTIAPVARIYITKQTYFAPFLEASIGPTYLTKTRFRDRNLGMHFAFQDLLGIGTTLGKDQRLYMVLDIMHYSNGSLCAMNAGITIPLLLRIGYRFS